MIPVIAHNMITKRTPPCSIQDNFKIVFAHVYDDNIRSIRLLKNLGFVQYETSKIMGDIGFKLRL